MKSSADVAAVRDRGYRNGGDIQPDGTRLGHPDTPWYGDLNRQFVQLYNLFMELVVDTSAIIAVIANGSEKSAIVKHTADASLIAPASVHWEVGNAFSAMFRRRRITLIQAKQAIRSYEQMPFRFVDIDLRQSLELSERLGLHAYDAYVLACALNSRSPLLTLDKKLAATASPAGIRVLEIDP